MHIRNVGLALLMCTVTSCAVGPAPSYAKRATPPLAPVSCTPLPEGLTLYGGVPFADVERLGRFPLQRPERRFLDTGNPLWGKFREGLEPTDLIFEYVYDEGFEGGPFSHGGVSAFRNGCTIKIEQVWTT